MNLHDLDGLSFFPQASSLYRDHGTVDTAAMMLDKAATFLAATRPDRAVALYKQAADIALVGATLNA